MRTLVFSIVRFAAILTLATSCGGGGGSTISLGPAPPTTRPSTPPTSPTTRPSTPPTTPPTSPPTSPPSTTQTVILGAPVTVELSSIASGASGSIAFPASHNLSPTATVTFQSTPPNGIRSPQSQNLGAVVSPLAYVTITSSDTASFWSMPTFTFTFPNGTLSGNVYLAFYDSNNAAFGWTAIAGPVNASGTTVTFSAPTLWQTYYANGTYVYAVVQTNSALSAQTVPMGPDYGLRRQCVRTLSPDQPNFWFSNVDCPGGAYPITRDWITLIEIENNGSTLGNPCIGSTNGQAVLINGPGSVATEQWSGSSSTGYSVDMRVDYTNLPNACAPPTYSAEGIQNNSSFSGAAEARPDQAIVQFDATYNRTLGNGGATHATVSVGEYWQAAGYANPIIVGLAIDTWDDPNVVFPPPCGPPDVLQCIVTVDPNSGTPTYAIVYYGNKLNPPIVTPPGVPQHITVNWGQLTAHAIAEGLVPPPINGWANSNASSGGVDIGFEVHNTIAAPGGPMADMVVSNIRESALIPVSSSATSLHRKN